MHYELCVEECSDNYIPVENECIGYLGEIEIDGKIHETTGKISHLDDIEINLVVNSIFTEFSIDWSIYPFNSNNIPSD